MLWGGDERSRHTAFNIGVQPEVARRNQRGRTVDSNFLRAFIALVLAALLWSQARLSTDRPLRQRGFYYAAGALLVLAGFNATLAMGISNNVVLIGFAVVGVLLIVVALISMVGSFRGGEMQSQQDRIAAAAKDFRERNSDKHQ